MKNLSKVNLSSSFCVRARCNRCGQKPSLYFYSRNPVLWHDPNKIKNVFQFMKQHYKRFSPDEFVLEHIRDAAKIGYYNHPVNYNAYSPRLHRVKGLSPAFDFIEFLGCGCGHSVWAFAQKSIKNKKEVFNRKGKYTF